MDLSVFLILLFVTLQFVAECYNWSQYRVKLGIFIATIIITLPNIVFMVIDWWQSPHSKMALLVLNTFRPILRGETYRLFRWLKSVGMGLTSDELNYLPISNPSNSADFFMTRECFDQASRSASFKVILEDDNVPEAPFPFIDCTVCTGFTMHYEHETVIVHEFRLSRKLMDLFTKLDCYEDFISHRSCRSSLIRSRTYTNVDVPTANRMNSRLVKMCYSNLPILADFESRREWFYFHAVSTLDYLDKDLVLIQAQGEALAVG